MTETPYGLTRLVNHNELELERFVDAHDTILPFFRVRLTGEHLAAWAVHGLREEGCRCRRLTGSAAVARRATRGDSQLVFYTTEGVTATIMRRGQEQALRFDTFETPEQEADFIRFIAELMCESATV